MVSKTIERNHLITFNIKAEVHLNNNKIIGSAINHSQLFNLYMVLQIEIVDKLFPKESYNQIYYPNIKTNSKYNFL